jgi:hypothetical protein
VYNKGGNFMPLSRREFENEIRGAGCSIRRTSKGHFLVIDPNGNRIEGYAVRHPGKEIMDGYVKRVRKAILQVKKL